MTLSEEHTKKIRENLSEEMKIVLQDIDDRIESLEREVSEK